MRKQWILLASCVFFLGSAACGSTPSPEASPTPTEFSTPVPTATHAPTPSQTPEPEAKVEIRSLTAGDTPNHWRVIGSVQNLTEHAASAVVQIIPLDQQGYPDQDEKSPEFKLLLAASSHSPFQADLWSTLQPPILHVNILDFQDLESDLLHLDVQTLKRWQVNGGEDLLMEFHNPHPTALIIEALTLIGMNADEQPVIVLTPTPPQWAILPLQSQPFGIDLQHTSEITGWEIMALGKPMPDFSMPQIRFVQEPILHLDAQGNPLLVGVLRNESTLPATFHATFLLKKDENLAAFASLSAPFPLPAGRDWPFTVTDFHIASPDWRELIAAGGDWQIQTTLSPETWNQSHDLSFPVSLTAKVTGYETTGSAIIFKGEVCNPFQHPLHHASITLSASSLNGTIVGAQTESWDGEFLPGEQKQFVLILRYPAAYEAYELELDAQALGFRQVPQLP